VLIYKKNYGINFVDSNFFLNFVPSRRKNEQIKPNQMLRIFEYSCGFIRMFCLLLNKADVGFVHCFDFCIELFFKPILFPHVPKYLLVSSASERIWVLMKNNFSR
jgi:hypothetical protein